jgi:hypothetical protein
MLFDENLAQVWILKSKKERKKVKKLFIIYFFFLILNHSMNLQEFEDIQSTLYWT